MRGVGARVHRKIVLQRVMGAMPGQMHTWVQIAALDAFVGVARLGGVPQMVINGAGISGSDNSGVWVGVHEV